MTTKTASTSIVGRPYSHGFESIYAFETIDPSSVRVMSAAPPTAASQVLDVKEPLVADPDLPFVKSSISPFFLKESVEILKLSSHAERFLRSSGHETIEQIMTLDFSDMSLLRGLGQGHIEEIRSKLKEFVRGRSLNNRVCVDYISWARSLFNGMDKRVVGVAFERYGLSDALPMSLTEKVEIKKLPQEKKQDWFCHFKSTCKSHHEAFDRDLHRVMEAFVLPWMLGRGGFASTVELKELSWRLGESREESESVLALFAELFSDGAHPFCSLPESCIAGIYTANQSTQKMIRCINKVLDTYFYAPGLVYALDELAGWCEREFACAWINLDREVFCRVVRQSRNYQTLLHRKGNGYIEIVRKIQASQQPQGR
jgi:hypothetical protein